EPAPVPDPHPLHARILRRPRSGIHEPFRYPDHMTPFRFDPTAYSPSVADLLGERRLMPLGPGSPVPGVRPRLAGLDLPPACLAGLWLYFDYLDESHTISQDDESDPDRNIWHAVMHRREPDAGNSKYWWRRVGPHPVLARLREHAP